MFDPMAVKSASDLSKDGPVVIERKGVLHLAARRPLLYSFHWLREVALGKMAGDLGLAIDAGGEAAVQFTVTGDYRQQFSLDERGWLRLQIFKHRTREFDFAAQVSVSAQAASPLPHQPDALVAAILGVHPLQRSEADAGRTLAPADLASFQTLDAWAKNRIEALFGPIQSEAGMSKFLEGMRNLLGLKASIYEQAMLALEKKYSAEVSYHYQSSTAETALVDCSFNFTAEGLRAYRQALDGDYSWILEADPRDVALRSAALTCEIREAATLELHLPFFDRKEWTTRLEALAKMEVASDEDGRLLVYHVEASQRIASKNSYQSVLALAGGLSIGRVHSSSSFTLAYSDQRRLPRAQAPKALAPVLQGYGFDPSALQYLTGLSAEGHEDLDVSLALSIPGHLVAAWLDAPGERDAAFFPVYSRVAVAVQRAMRTWLPYTYFSGLDPYETLEAAFPLLVYQVSRPCTGKPKYDFNYDVMSPESMATFFRLAAPQLPKELARVEQALLAAGKKSTAEFYSPKQARNILGSVQRRPRLLNSLLVADALFVDALINLGCRGRQLREKAEKDPSEAVKQLSRFAAEFVKAFHGRLRRLYGNQEFLALGGLMLVEATNALSEKTDGAHGVQAVLRIAQGQSLDQTLVNAAYLP